MRRMIRPVFAASALTALAATAAGCSSGLAEPEESAIMSTREAPTTKETSEASSTAEKTVTETTTEKVTEDESGYSYSRIQNSDRYFIEVGLGEAGQEASFPRCDGRYVLIVDSIVDEAGDADTFQRLAHSVLTASTPPREFTVPGQCSSLRKQVDGNVIYPVYLDFGRDKAGLCSAQSRYGGNARTLNNSGDFTDPCG